MGHRMFGLSITLSYKSVEMQGSYKGSYACHRKSYMSVSYYIQVIEGNNIDKKILAYKGRRRQRYMS